MATETHLYRHQLVINPGNILVTTSTSRSPTPGIAFTSPDFHFLKFFPSLSTSAYNPATAQGDTGIIFSSGTYNGIGAGLVIVPWSSSQVGIRITATGNIGIGRTSPQNRLVVSGNVGVNGNLKVTGTIYDSTGQNVSGPIGAVIAYGGSTAPTGWLLCNGASVSTTTYANLFAVIGYTYGGSGASFTLPDLRGRNPLGVSGSYARGTTGGATTETLTTTEMPSHDHYAPDLFTKNNGSLRTGGSHDYIERYTSTHTQQWTAYTGGGAAHNILDSYQAVNFIIHY